MNELIQSITDISDKYKIKPETKTNINKYNSTTIIKY